MPNLSTETKQRITTVVSLAKTTFRYGFIPYVLYLGKFMHFVIRFREKAEMFMLIAMCIICVSQ